MSTDFQDLPEDLNKAVPTDCGAVEIIALRNCWRCAKAVSITALDCPFCEASLAGDTLVPSTQRRSEAGSPIVPLCGFFAALLATSILQSFVSSAVNSPLDPSAAAAAELWVMLFAEVIDTIIVVCAWAFIARRLPPPMMPAPRPLLAFAISPVVLAAALAVNFGYHALLRAWIDWPLDIEIGLLDSGQTAFAVLIVCVQPAIVEELFFRYLAFGALRGSMGIHAAVLVSSIMFGMAHVGMPVSIPMLIVLGMAFGYMRVLSGGMALPMLMHFFHNAVVLVLEHLDS